MDTPNPQHPTHEALRAYSLGRLDDASAEGVHKHLGDCQECQRQVAEMLPDSFLDRLRDAQEGPDSSAAGAAGPGVSPAGPTVDDHATVDSSASPCMSSTGQVDATSDALSSPADTSLPSGTRIGYFGDYELLKVLGEGGMGIVYKARQLSLNRPVALKMIKAARFASPDEVRRFQNESEAVARLDHPNIVPVFEVGQYEDQHYFSMKLIAGDSLDKRPKQYMSEPRRAAELLAISAGAIHHAHQRGILHRDLKPANILIDSEGRPHVTDFGLAKRIEGDSELTRSGSILGTPAYMAPEQASGKRGVVTTSTDVYGLGAILFAVLTGQAPFSGATVIDVLEQVRERAPDSPRKLNPGVPRDLEVVCLKCLEKDARRRYASAGALAEDLKHWLVGEPIAARPVGNAARFWMWCRRRPIVAALSTAVLMAVLGGLIGTSLGLHAALRAQAEERKQTDLAKQRLQDAIEAKAKERLQTELAEQRLYDVQMNLVQRYWEDYHGELFKKALDDLAPANQGGVDRRGFEWFFWQRSFSSGHVTLKGRGGRVCCVAFSADGKRLASGNYNGTVNVWDTDSGHEIRTFTAHTPMVYSIAFSADGKRLASGSDTVKMWNSETGQELANIKGHSGAVWYVAFSPDGKRLASASETVMVSDAETGRQTWLFGPVAQAAFSADLRRVAYNNPWENPGQNGVLKIWDVAGRQVTLTLNGHSAFVDNSVFSADGKLLASADSDRTVKIWDVGTGHEIRALKAHFRAVSSFVYSTNGSIKYTTPQLPRTSLVFSPDGKRLASAGQDWSVRVWEVMTGEESLVLKGHVGGVSSVAFSPDGKRLASAGEDETVKLWDAGGAHQALTLRGPAASDSEAPSSRWLAFSPDGKRLAAASWDGMVKMWDAATGQETLAILGPINGPRTAALSPGGERLASADWDGTLKIWDTVTGQVTTIRRGHDDGVMSLVFSPDGKRLAAAMQGGIVKLWDARTGQESLVVNAGATASSTVGAGAGARSIAFSPDGERIAAGGMDRTVKVWDAATGQETLTLNVLDRARSVAFSPDGRWLDAAGSDGTFRVWDAKTGKQTFDFNRSITAAGDRRTAYLLELSEHRIAFSPDGQRLAAADEDGTVKIWDVATGQGTLTLKGQSGPLVFVTFSPDGKLLVTADGDATAKMWDVATGQGTLILKGHSAPVLTMMFSPDGKRLAAATVDGMVNVWDARPLDGERGFAKPLRPAL